MDLTQKTYSREKDGLSSFETELLTFSWGRPRYTQNNSQSRGSGMHLEDGKLEFGFKSPPEMIDESWQTQYLLTALSGSMCMNSPGW